MSDASSSSQTNALSRFLRTETVGGTALLMAAFVALVWANSPWADAYQHLGEIHVGTDSLSLFGQPLHLRLTLAEWAKDGLLAIFFFVAGLELKRELVVGELSTLRSAALPVICATGGVVVPALIAFAVAHDDPRIASAWAIPIATDIAFALGILSLTGSRLPSGARVFLLGLAVVDDLIAIVVIAVLFSTGLSLLWLGVAVAGCAAYALAQHRRITTPLLYIPLAALVWIAMLQSGVHATIAGVALGLLTRVRRDKGELEAPAERLEHRIQPFSALVCVPIFAFFASGVAINGEVFRALFTDKIALAIIAGLFFGKIIGIFGSSTLAVKLRIAERPEGLFPRDILALSVLGAIGFTVSLLVAELSLGDGADLAKAAVLLTSLVASVIGSLLLLRRGRAHTNT
ncbi:Na(+)/H(+) antiporter NhaA OS=Tsukamurella paurometabola (strain ATCC 8368 / DSM / CCUG 35730/ CIP 100753 / JCM 10117 / KCTC 9821 / NBRC 16120 / NCIMB 702349 / NCTC 13040) OX=521096 GN=nhaA PE=3 SV=1 [Tsukamurella paurometabola]|uniref:Na(+)/H(+) antiporter NhaA n=1 Tax=Tsukamurella paurometabola (strain ATCC 8368 / DSM 20162 / CCUG 35730 / CIP 100753 / JCM 10117 / KCTC 9821 / NBRC 16120 / NCIMB 702349 / NCTC 13040) TaxID=521096 RepID=D5UMM2_TSUPD|nr:Na+/H+ antiporter NhaA [Tsukamurella paurometabola]ADG80496.1 Na+/H+ antiporter NhaA [Tsukamurella paurometabola DSM 20162]SUP39862.1 Sodium/proton antiporter nhaA [Tsukamurella paurometabola]